MKTKATLLLKEKRVDAAGEIVELGVRDLARVVNRDVKRVHQDAQVLVELGLIEKDERGALSCPYDHIHIDMMMDAQDVA